MPRTYAVKKLQRSPDYFKREKFMDYLTLGELAIEVGKDPSWIKKLERDGRLPKPKRVRRGALHIRMYSQYDVELIREFFDEMKPGKPRKD